MKRMLIAVSLAVLAVPAFAQHHGNADGARGHHSASERAQSDAGASSQTGSSRSTAAGSTSAATGRSAAGWATGVWANDHNFIVPAP